MPPIFPSQEDYLLIDIETTGLRTSKDRITEIDLVVIKKGAIHTKWHSHINAKKKINSSPTFSDIAPKLLKLFKNKTIVAHNASFVYEFLKAEMLRCQITLDEKILCSLSLSRFLFPESKEHNLKAINARLSCDVREETKLTLLLNFFSKLEMLLTPQDLKNKLQALTQSSEGHLNLEHKGVIPSAPGIYQCYDDNNVVIYIGKSASLSDSLASHFQLNDSAHKELNISKQIKKIDWIRTYGELGTFLLAAQQIKTHRPLFNRLVEKTKNLFTLQLLNNGEYLALKVTNIATLKSVDFPATFGIFKNEKDAVNLLRFFINESQLCYQVNALGKMKNPCFRFKINKCNGACHLLEPAKEYNDRIHKIMKTFTQNKWPFKNKIAIKESCDKTANVHFHIVDNWTYLGTVNSLENISELVFENTDMDAGIYKHLHKILTNKENQSSIIKIAS